MPRRRGPLVITVVLALALIGLWVLWPEPGPESQPNAQDLPVVATPRARRDDLARPAGPSTAIDEQHFARVVTAAPDAGEAGGSSSASAVLDTFARGQVVGWLEENAQQAAKHVDAYCDATKDLRAAQPPPSPRERDAALFLLGRSDWEGGRLGTLHLSSALTERMKNPPGAWRQFGAADTAGLDFSWMKALQQFDHWSMVPGSPLSDSVENTSFFEAPIPNFVTLQSWAKLRLVKGRVEGDLVAASAEVRHLADLCGSTGTLVGEMIRLSILGIERSFIEEHHLGLAPALSWVDATRTRHAAFNAVDFLLPGVDPAVRAKALTCAPNRCSALNEAMGVARAVKDLVPSGGADLQWLIDQKPCDPALVELSKRFKPMNPAELLASGGFPSLDEGMARLLDAGTPPP